MERVMPVAIVGFLFFGLYTIAYTALVSRIDQLDAAAWDKHQRQ